MITQKILDRAKTKLEAKAREFAERVAPFYRDMQWGWSPNGVPTVEDIQATVMCLIQSLEPSEGTTVDVSTGGIDVTVTYYPKVNRVYAEIAFVPERKRTSFAPE